MDAVDLLLRALQPAGEAGLSGHTFLVETLPVLALSGAATVVLGASAFDVVAGEGVTGAESLLAEFLYPSLR